MPAPEKNRWVEWRAIAKERKEAARIHFNEWVAACQEEPALIWQTSLVRYATYLLGAIILAVLLTTMIDLFQPVSKEEMSPRAKTAYFQIICSNPSCGRNFVIERKFSFDDFPVWCSHCNHETGTLALRCFSERCDGRFVSTIEQDGARKCAVCGRPIGEP